MTDKEIKKALECAAGSEILCKDCAYLNIPYPACKARVANDALDLINRYEAEISVKNKLLDIAEEKFKTIRTEAIKEFAERLKKRKHRNSLDGRIVFFDVVEVDDIDTVKKEMTEGQNNV